VVSCNTGQENVYLLQHLQLCRRPGASSKLIQFYLNNVTNLHQLTSHRTTSCPATWKSYRDHRLLWRHFSLSVLLPSWQPLRNTITTKAAVAIYAIRIPEKFSSYVVASWKRISTRVYVGHSPMLICQSRRIEDYVGGYEISMTDMTTIIIIVILFFFSSNTSTSEITIWHTEQKWMHYIPEVSSAYKSSCAFRYDPIWHDHTIRYICARSNADKMASLILRHGRETKNKEKLKTKTE